MDAASAIGGGRIKFRGPATFPLASAVCRDASKVAVDFLARPLPRNRYPFRDVIDNHSALLSLPHRTTRCRDAPGPDRRVRMGGPNNVFPGTGPSGAE